MFTIRYYHFLYFKSEIPSPKLLGKQRFFPLRRRHINIGWYLGKYCASVNKKEKKVRKENAIQN